MSFLPTCVLAAIAAMAIGCTSTGDDLYEKLPDASPIDAIVFGDADTTDADTTDGAAVDAQGAPDAQQAPDALVGTD